MRLTTGLFNILLLLCLGLTAQASSTRIILEDVLKSSDLSKTWNMPAIGDTLAGISATQTLTNKSISGSSNTLSNISVSSLASGESPAFTWTEDAQTGTTYTLVLSDGSGATASPYVSLNNASAVTVTVPTNASVAFPVGTVVPIVQKGFGGVKVAAAGGVTLNSLNGNVDLLGQFAKATLLKTATNVWDLFGDLYHPSLATATGGTITTDGDYKVHVFTSSGTFQVTAGMESFQFLVVAGGGGGGYSTTNSGGGGGAGGLIAGSLVRGVGSYTVTVGSGGAGGSVVDAAAPSGANSVFDSVVATGGGGGANGGHAGGNGGSGGGAGQQSSGGGGTGGTGIAGQGNNGGSLSGGNGGSGGGGAGAVGANGNVQPNGGIGIQSDIVLNGTQVYYAGGGGGGTYLGTAGTGGLGGGGAGAQTDGNGTAGTVNTGGGGGGAAYGTGGGPYNGAAGGSGIVVVRYKFQ